MITLSYNFFCFVIREAVERLTSISWHGSIFHSLIELVIMLKNCCFYVFTRICNHMIIYMITHHHYVRVFLCTLTSWLCHESLAIFQPSFSTWQNSHGSGRLLKTARLMYFELKCCEKNAAWPLVCYSWNYLWWTRGWYCKHIINKWFWFAWRVRKLTQS
jgi:hypothetical protein